MSLPILERLEVASPCPASWDEMEGDERVRFCRRCELHVYDFSAMTEAEVERLVLETEGNLCGRLYGRADGKILTKDCPVGWRAARRRIKWLAASIAAAVAAGMTLGFAPDGRGTRCAGPFTSIQCWFRSPAPPPPRVIMGRVSMHR